jgi:hypothetical protein
MSKEIKLAIQKYSMGVITRTELVINIYRIAYDRPEQTEEILHSLDGLPDPLSDLAEDVRRVKMNSSADG